MATTAKPTAAQVMTNTVVPSEAVTDTLSSLALDMSDPNVTWAAIAVPSCTMAASCDISIISACVPLCPGTLALSKEVAIDTTEKDTHRADGRG